MLMMEEEVVDQANITSDLDLFLVYTVKMRRMT